MSGYGSGAYGEGVYGGDAAVAVPGISVAADSSETPPRFEITITTPDGSVMNAVALTRTARGVTVPTRVQPLPGFATRFVPEYESDWDTPVSFTATITTDSGVATYTSTPIALVPAQAWIIHPLVPTLSFPFDSRRLDRVGARSLGAVSRPSTSTRLRPIGAKYPVQIRNGTRQASQSQLAVTTVTAAEEAAMWAVLDDQTPLLIRVPPAWGWGFEDGYYDVDGPAVERSLQYGPDQQRVWTLPLFRVAPPAGTQQSTWSYADLLDAFADYPSLIAAFADYPSLLANNRR